MTGVDSETAHARVVQADAESLRSRGLRLPELRDKHVVVTGAGGFIAAYLIEVLLALEPTLRITGLVRNLERARTRFGAHAWDERLRLSYSDVGRDIPDIAEPIDFIIHAASQASPKYYSVDPVGTLAPNVFGTQMCLELARRDGATLLYLSSGDVYGVVAQETIGEDDYGFVDPLNVRSCYGESKRMAETMCVAWSHQYGVRTRIARIFHTYGPGMRLDDGRVFSDFVNDILASRDIVMRSDGSAVRAFCYLEDAVAAFLTILLSGSNGRAYNMGNAHAAVTIRQLADILVGLYPERQLAVVRTDELSSAAYTVSPMKRGVPDTRALEELGWSAKYDIAAGFRRTIESYGSR